MTLGNPNPLRICRYRIPPRGGGGRIRTYEGVSRQIYSLLPLAAWVPLREKRAAYSDFRYLACQCRFRANSPFFLEPGLEPRTEPVAGTAVSDTMTAPKRH